MAAAWLSSVAEGKRVDDREYAERRQSDDASRSSNDHAVKKHKQRENAAPRRQPRTRQPTSKAEQLESAQTGTFPSLSSMVRTALTTLSPRRLTLATDGVVRSKQAHDTGLLVYQRPSPQEGKAPPNTIRAPGHCFSPSPPKGLPAKGAPGLIAPAPPKDQSVSDHQQGPG
jgi:hypothetical protein